MTTQTATSNVGAGQQYPDDSNSEFDVTAFIVRQIIAELETMIPVQVQAVHPGSGSPPAAGTVDVQLLVSLLDGSGNATQQGIVYGLPYFRVQGGPWAVVIDPAENDFGYIIGAARDISNVVKNPGIANPGSYRKYSFSDGIYMGGCLNPVPAATIWCKSDGTLDITDKNGNSLISSSSGWSLTGNLSVTGSVAATADVIAQKGSSQISLTDHLHGGVQTGADESGPPVAGT